MLLAHPCEQDRARLHPFFPSVMYHVLSLPKRPNPQSSGLRVSVVYICKGPVASSSSLVFPLSARCSEVCRALVWVGFMCCSLGNQGLSGSNSGFLLHLVRFLVVHYNKCVS